MMNYPFPIPNIRKECNICYTLLYVTYWEYNTNLQPRYMIGSFQPMSVMSNPVLIVKAYCGKCNVQITREYRDIDGRFILTSEHVFQEHYLDDLIHHHV